MSQKLKMGRLARRLGLGTAALTPTAYAAVVMAARRRAPAVALDFEIETVIDRELAWLGATGAHHYLSTRVGRIHALEIGGEGRALVVLHGLGASSANYLALMVALAGCFRVIAIDRPGAGLSDPVRFAGHPRPAWNEVVAAVAAALNLGRFDLVGHSLGGLAAGGFAVDHPQSVRRLVLLAPLGISPALPIGWMPSMVPGAMDLLGALDQRAMDRQAAAGASDMAGLSWGPVRVGPDPKGLRHLVSRRFATGSDLESVPRLMRPFRFRPESLLLPGLGLLAGRTLVLWGDRDSQVALPPARRQLEFYPGLELSVLPRTGHLFPFEDPVGTAALIRSYLDS